MKSGMGALGYTEQQTLDTSIIALEWAYEGRADMLRAIFGGGEPDAPAALSVDETKAAIRQWTGRP